MLRNVALEAGSLLRLIFTPFLRAWMPCYANIVNTSKVLLDFTSLLRLIFTPFLWAWMPRYADAVNKSKVILDSAPLLRLILTSFLWACMPCYANIVNTSEVLLDIASLLRLIFTSILGACIPFCANTVLRLLFIPRLIFIIIIFTTITITIPRVIVLVIVFFAIVISVFHSRFSLSLLAPAVGPPFSNNLHILILILITWLANKQFMLYHILLFNKYLASRSSDATCCRFTLIPSLKLRKDTMVLRSNFFHLTSFYFGDTRRACVNVRLTEI